MELTDFVLRETEASDNTKGKVNQCTDGGYKQAVPQGKVSVEERVIKEGLGAEAGQGRASGEAGTGTEA